MGKKHHALVPVERIERAILSIRGRKVMLDSDLAELYDVEVRALVQAVKRNAERFPSDFMFRLDHPEWRAVRAIRSQSVILERGRGAHRKYLPYVFTEQGVAMLSSVLRSDRAVQVNVAIMRAFVRLRQLAASHADLARRLDALERTSKDHGQEIKAAFKILRALMAPPPEPEKKGRIGFASSEKD